MQNWRRCAITCYRYITARIFVSSKILAWTPFDTLLKKKKSHFFLFPPICRKAWAGKVNDRRSTIWEPFKKGGQRKTPIVNIVNNGVFIKITENYRTLCENFREHSIIKAQGEPRFSASALNLCVSTFGKRVNLCDCVRRALKISHKERENAISRRRMAVSFSKSRRLFSSARKQSVKTKYFLWGGVKFSTGSYSLLKRFMRSERVKFPYRRYSPDDKRNF